MNLWNMPFIFFFFFILQETSKAYWWLNPKSCYLVQYLWQVSIYSYRYRRYLYKHHMWIEGNFQSCLSCMDFQVRLSFLPLKQFTILGEWFSFIHAVCTLEISSTPMNQLLILKLKRISFLGCSPVSKRKRKYLFILFLSLIRDYWGKCNYCAHLISLHL